MHQSQVIEELLKPKEPVPPEVDREEKISYVIKKIKEIDSREDLGISLVIGLLFSFFITIIITSIYSQLSKSDFSFDYPILLWLPMILFSVIAVFLMSVVHYISQSYLTNYFENLKKRFLTLFSLLTDKRFEIKITKNKTFFPSQIKFVVEENEYVGNGIIKDKSRHFTAYLNIKSTVEEKVAFIQTLILKAENDFAPKVK